MPFKPKQLQRRYSPLAAAVFATLVICSSGCRMLGPMPMEVKSQHFAPELIDSDKPQIEIGKPNRLIDGIGWTLGIPTRILLWDRRVDRHKISEPTVLATADYLEHNNLPHVKVRLNQYAPLDDWKRLKKNTAIAWPTRYTLGALSVAGETLLPGRLIGGDHFNPFTQTIHLYSDVPSIALHEAAHAKDFTRREHQDAYAAAYALLPIWHETIATEDVFAYLEYQGTDQEIAEAHRILYPAYGTYVGNMLGPLSGSYAVPMYLGGVAAGHVNGRILARRLTRNGAGLREIAQEDVQPETDPPDANSDLIRQVNATLSDTELRSTRD